MIIRLLFILISLYFISPVNGFCQVSGNISNNAGEALPFATIFIEGTSIGTTSNIEGDFKLELEKGDYILIFQYVGYKQKKVSIQLGEEVVELMIILEDEVINIEEVVISADAEDPAYPIIRKAIAKRKYYKDLVKSYSARSYTKGTIKLIEVPEKILGQELGDLGGILDSTRAGIVYLSEAESNIFFKSPNDFKEVMISSKVAGDDQGFSFNEANPREFILYNNFVELGARNIASPISENAFLYYKYKLVGTLLDEQGHLINKIEVISKNEFGPAFFGFIYITEDLWNIQSTELYLTGKASKFPIMDTLVLRQTYIPVKAPDSWMLFSQSITFSGGIIGIKMNGDFTSIFSQFDLDTVFKEGYFSNEIFTVNEDANQKDSTYWESVRPIPLTEPEIKDYVKKDSLQVVWKSKVFLDSIDRVNNKFKVGNLFFGYSYNRSFNKRYFTFQSPLSTIQFNTVQGFTGNIIFSYRQEFDDEQRNFVISPQVQYGFSDNIFRASGRISTLLSRKKRQRMFVAGGRTLNQFSRSNPVDITLNTFYSLFSKENYLKSYDKRFIQWGYSHELSNGVYLRSFAEYATRKSVQNSSDYSFFQKEETYLSNDPRNPLNFEPSFEPHKAFILDLHLRVRIGQKYMNYPNRVFRFSSSWPDFYFHYQKAISIFGTDTDFDKLSFGIRKGEVHAGILGNFGFHAQLSDVLSNGELPFIDHFHQNGNRFIISNPSSFLNSFKRMPYYEFSTRDFHGKLFFEHHFEGFILDRLPLIKHLGAKSVVGFNAFYENEEINYYEASFGIESLGIGVFRLFRIDYVWSFDHSGLRDHGLLIGLGASF